MGWRSAIRNILIPARSRGKKSTGRIPDPQHWLNQMTNRTPVPDEPDVDPRLLLVSVHADSDEGDQIRKQCRQPLILPHVLVQEEPSLNQYRFADPDTDPAFF
jgi:hypothetical protein